LEFGIWDFSMTRIEPAVFRNRTNTPSVCRFSGYEAHEPQLTARVSHSSTRASADPRTADLCTRRIYFALNKIASWPFSGPLVALC
jgi:hypothetical protein